MSPFSGMATIEGSPDGKCFVSWRPDPPSQRALVPPRCGPSTRRRSAVSVSSPSSRRQATERNLVKERSHTFPGKDRRSAPGTAFSDQSLPVYDTTRGRRPHNASRPTETPLTLLHVTTCTLRHMKAHQQNTMFLTLAGMNFTPPRWAPSALSINESTTTEVRGSGRPFNNVLSVESPSPVNPGPMKPWLLTRIDETSSTNTFSQGCTYVYPIRGLAKQAYWLQKPDLLPPSPRCQRVRWRGHATRPFLAFSHTIQTLVAVQGMTDVFREIDSRFQ